MTIQEELAKFVNDTLIAKNLSTYDVEENAKRAGLSITQSYVNRVKNGKAGNLSVPKQRALAIGLGVEPNKIYDIVNGIKRKPNNFTEELLEAAAGAENFHEDLRTDLLQTIRRLVIAMKSENVSLPKKKEDLGEGIALSDFKFIPTKTKKTA